MKEIVKHDDYSISVSTGDPEHFAELTVTTETTTFTWFIDHSGLDILIRDLQNADKVLRGKPN
jgi:hypothetical protein